ncbi:hypothetical protein AJ78_08720 [Emergomyces pasteurianus Ep9510]|uniref:Peptidase S9 prolyl oligopeptidase catalytic domain-containing protein n=1 Tax=Emergomyces pasteurianus Ep9510 TaxID=1447872 RepID=A0A1J9Q1M2_9EURO|nr:hypothetical protein AJ78_08720 [Emergomyces pasteurianus Ep9510]
MLPNRSSIHKHPAEATWGADPLEVLGGVLDGFRILSFDHDPTARFSSALGINRTVGWSVLEAPEPELEQKFQRIMILDRSRQWLASMLVSRMWTGRFSGRFMAGLGYRWHPRVMGLELDASSVLVAEVVNEKLASPLDSVIFTGPALSLLDGRLMLAPYQSRPVAFKIDFYDQVPSNFFFQLGYKYTFLHPAGVVFYAILRPPLNASCNSTTNANGQQKLPILVDLHGAGLEAAVEQVRHMLDAVYGVCAWMLFSTGVTPWSGDDWHTWGAADIEAAVAAIPNWMEAVGWECLGVALENWLVSGHSNGGQGAWFLLTHQPDRVIAAAPVSGYSSIEAYVPFTMWHDGQAAISSVIQTARQNFKHELLMRNFAGIPILQQHGSADDNVPAYHSRLLHLLISENGWHSEYYDLPEKGHWFDGVLTTPTLLDFYSRHTSQPSFYDHLLPDKFSFSIPSSGDMGSRGGIIVDQLTSPDKYGHIHVVREAGAGLWRVKTRNVHRFHLLPSSMRVTAYPVKISVDDGSKNPFKVPAANSTDTTWFVKDESTGTWTVSDDVSWRDDIMQRHGRQNGAMDAFLRSTGRFTIKICSREGGSGIEQMKVALQTSRNLLQYFAADSQIIQPHCDIEEEEGISGPGNVITIAIGNDLPHSLLSTFPIHVDEEGHLIVHTADFHAAHTGSSISSATKYPFELSLGAIFLRPLPRQRLELVVWGADVAGLQQASRLVPLLTGVSGSLILWF